MSLNEPASRFRSGSLSSSSRAPSVPLAIFSAASATRVIGRRSCRLVDQPKNVAKIVASAGADDEGGRERPQRVLGRSERERLDEADVERADVDRDPEHRRAVVVLVDLLDVLAVRGGVEHGRGRPRC
jgi:hypothetical protein